MADWNSAQYLKFQNERTQPAIDMANRIPIENPKKILDIGCGPGNSTQVLAQRYPNAYILGVDNSKNMIDTAKKAHPSLDFAPCDASKDLPSLCNDFDIVFSNACIQWIPGHHQLLKNMLGLLNQSGVLAVQIPMNYNEPIHKIIGKVTTNDKWKESFPNPRIFYNLSQSGYFDLLSELSSGFSIWETTYYHKMKSHNDIMEWYKSTGLKPYLDALPDEKRADFLQDIYDRVEKEYPVQKSGEIIFRFPRFFFIAGK